MKNFEHYFTEGLGENWDELFKGSYSYAVGRATTFIRDLLENPRIDEKTKIEAAAVLKILEASNLQDTLKQSGYSENVDIQEMSTSTSNKAPKRKMSPEELQSFLQFKKKGGVHDDSETQKKKRDRKQSKQNMKKYYGR